MVGSAVVFLLVAQLICGDEIISKRYRVTVGARKPEGGPLGKPLAAMVGKSLYLRALFFIPPTLKAQIWTSNPRLNTIFFTFPKDGHYRPCAGWLHRSVYITEHPSLSIHLTL